MNRQIFKECQVSSLQNVSKVDDEQPEMAMSLNEIVARHHEQFKNDKKESNVKLHFIVDKPNRYETAEDAQKIVEMNIIDILYNNKLSNLVYMRDITNYINQTSAVIA